MYKIYKYTNLINDKIYIGQTKNTLEQRALNGTNYKGSTYFYNAIQKYGWDNFKPEILKDDIETAEEANIWEDYFIMLFNSTNPDVGYNLNRGGNNRNTSERTRKIISEKAKERYKDKTKNPMYGKTHSADAIQKMSDKKRGSNNPSYGRKQSSETIEKRKKTCLERNVDYSHEWSDEERERASKRFKEYAKKWSKRVRCLEDELVFDTITAASAFYNVDISTLSGHLRGKQKTCAGKHFEIIS